jgi:hemoglobin
MVTIPARFSVLNRPFASRRPLCFAIQCFCAALAMMVFSGCDEKREPRFNHVQFAVQTGKADLAGSSSATATLRSKHGRVLQEVVLKAGNQPAWKTGSTHYATFALKDHVEACEIGNIDITLHPANPPVKDGNTWSIEQVSATLSIDNVNQTVIVSDTGNPLANLTASQPAFQIAVPCKKQAPLYTRLGSKAGIVSVVDDFVQRLEQDNRINQSFQSIASHPERLEEFKERMVNKICELSGGPCHDHDDSGKSPLTDVGTSVADNRAIIQDFVLAMGKFPASASIKDKNELLGAPLLSANGTFEPLARAHPGAPTGSAGIVGGPVATPIYVNLYWDTTWNTDHANLVLTTQAFDSYLQATTGSSYFAGLAQYGVMTPTFGGSFLPSPACTPKAPASVGFYDPANPSIIGFLQCELDHDTSVPQGDNIVYNIILPQTSTETDALAVFFGNTPFCVPNAAGTIDGAWHFHGTPYSQGEFLGGVLGFILGGLVGDPVQGAIVGYLLAASQQGGPFYTISSASPSCTNFTDNVVHEMVEAASDPSPPLSVIMSGTGEIADLCEMPSTPPSASWDPNSKQITFSPGGFLSSQIPQYQSNAIGTCVTGFGDLTKPMVTGVSLSGSFPNASVTITGSGFGTIPAPFVIPTSTNLPYLGIQDTAQNWQAGNSLNSDPVGLTVTSWTPGSISISGFSPPGGSNLMMAASDMLAVWVCSPSSGMCGSGMFPANTSGSGLNPSDIIRLGVTITTGDDDARADSELWLSIPNTVDTFCLKPSNNASPSPVCMMNGGSATDQNGRQGWPSGSTDPGPQVFTLTMPAPKLPGMNIRLISHNSAFENDDNWDIQAITVTGTTRGGSVITLLTLAGPLPPNSGNCTARLKAAPNASTVSFTLDGTGGHTYFDGSGAERGATTTCTNNGDQ